MNENSKYIYTPLPNPFPITEHNWPEGTLPLLHTRTMTYMHEDYISECIEGILMQKTNFPVQVFIHDDASTDKTAEIVREYEQKYPRLIKVYYQKENSHTKIDRYERRAEFRSWLIGKYEAICEGDDYWIDPNKLQKQVDFLENNPEYGMCYTKAKLYHQSQKRFFMSFIRGREINSLEELFYTNNPVPTLTVCLRKELLDNYLEEIKPETRKWKVIGDIPRTIWCLCRLATFEIGRKKTLTMMCSHAS